ncbi:MAG TPA: glycosyltransferase 87 family protein [Vicinamibacterales bacterium]|nr:glycosyltransferase 87 family protein [Vicinamibacterales bacterium]
MTRKHVIGVVLLILIATVVFAVRISSEMRDFEVYWTGGVHAAAGEPLYSADDGHYRYKYFPAFAVLAIPLSLIPLPAAKVVWFAASVVLLVLLIRLSVDLLPERRAPAVLLATSIVVVLGKFLGHELALGQANLLFAVLAVWAVVAMKTGRETLAGALIALTIAVKPYGVILLPWLIARKQRASIVAATIALAVIVVLPVPWYGLGTIALYRDWLTTVTETTAPTLTSQDSVSFASMFAKWLSPGPLATALATITSIGAVAMAGAVFKRRSEVSFPEALEASVLLMLVPMLSPQGWDYVLLLGAPAVAMLANYRDRLPAALNKTVVVAALAMGLSIYDLMGRRAFGAFMQAGAISLCASVMIATLYVMRVRKIA